MNRNDACSCGSGKRFKHCHGQFESAGPSALHREALTLHRAGSLTQAEVLYRRALESNSRDADSLHMLGVLQFERSRYREALELMWQAAELTGWSDAVMRQNMGLVLAKLLGPLANTRQRDLVAAYAASERERNASPALAVRVSVVLPICKPSRFVARAIASVTGQTYTEIQLVVVDEIGTDEMAPVAAALSRSPFPVKVVSSRQRGWAEAANEGARHAEGRYLAFLDADEFFAPNRVERMVAAIARATPSWGYSRVGTSGNAIRRGPSGAVRGGDSPAHDFRSSELPSFALLRRNAMESNGNLFIDRDLFRAVGGYAEVGENPGWDLCVRAAQVVEPVPVAEPLYFRDDDGSRFAGPSMQARDRFVAALVENAMKRNAGASNPFSPHFAANRDLLLRAELRAGRGDRLPVPMLRSIAAEWRDRAPSRPACGQVPPAQQHIRKTCVVVLGVYRSGTSAIARTLNLCGAFLPAGVVVEDLRLNPKGFWETEAINDLDARLLHRLGADWNRVDFDLPREDPLIDEFLASSRELLALEYGDAPLILMKDPRMGVLAPLWHRSLQECGYRPVYAVVVRNPLEVARSFEAHGDMPIADGLALWLAYMQRVTMFIDSGDVDAACVRYTALLDDWRSVVRRIARRLDVPLAADERADEVDRFLDAAMRKHRATEEQLEAHLAGRTGDAIRVLYRQLLERCDHDAEDAHTTPGSAANANTEPPPLSEIPARAR